MNHFSSRRAQRGSTLLVALIFLLIFAVLAAATYRNSLTSVQAIGNMQWRNEAITAANDVLDRLLSSTQFASNAAALTAQVNSTPFRFDMNSDGTSDIEVTFPEVTLDGIPRAGPRCLRAEPIPAKDLDPSSPEDILCYDSAAPANPGLGLAPAPSLCSNSEWTITVRARDLVTDTTVDVAQGVGVRVRTTAIPACN